MTVTRGRHFTTTRVLLLIIVVMAVSLFAALWQTVISPVIAQSTLIRFCRSRGQHIHTWVSPAMQPWVDRFGCADCFCEIIEADLSTDPYHPPVLQTLRCTNSLLKLKVSTYHSDLHELRNLSTRPGFELYVDGPVSLVVLEHISTIKQICALHLGARPSPEALTTLKRASELVTLTLENVDDNTLSGLAGHSQLTDLSLRHSSCTGSGIRRHLGALPKMTGLSFQFCNIGDESIADLSKMVQLRSLFIGGSRISVEGAKELKRALPDCFVH